MLRKSNAQFAEQDCSGALMVTASPDTFQAYVGTGAQNELTYPNNTTCLIGGEQNSVWITFTLCDSGYSMFEIIPNSFGDDYDWALYNFTNNICDSNLNLSQELRCNYSAIPGPTGIDTLYTNLTSGANQANQCAALSAFPGQRLLLLVNNHSFSANGFMLSFTGSSLPCNYSAISSAGNEKISIFPNPSNGTFEVKNLPSMKNVQIELLDVFGRLVYYDDNLDHAEKISVNAPDGFYLLRILWHNTFYSQKEIVIDR
ncbi:MAG: T9SS type A sorting domain-containing protein [Chitinophagales bacterium]